MLGPRHVSAYEILADAERQARLANMATAREMAQRIQQELIWDRRTELEIRMEMERRLKARGWLR